LAYLDVFDVFKEILFDIIVRQFQKVIVLGKYVLEYSYEIQQQANELMTCILVLGITQAVLDLTEQIRIQ
jgi:hypothetical protein